ncbi:BnaC01g21590D [Brassica napus]|uniref:(rape) hypothetical protein n=1 Tax=Brassica napus TaxID=3708 RepID=A0A078HAH3_BRANA|nr:unnamed protein product [Brassica napus]CDY34474.1 BnaC01g21590D [Brassica napus]
MASFKNFVLLILLTTTLGLVIEAAEKHQAIPSEKKRRKNWRGNSNLSTNLQSRVSRQNSVTYLTVSIFTNNWPLIFLCSKTTIFSLSQQLYLNGSEATTFQVKLIPCCFCQRG